MGALQFISDASSVATTFGNLVMVSPQATIGYQPIDTNGKPLTAFLFHYETENTVALKSDITDHYIEDNTAINSHIGLAPETITVHGFIGELTDVPVGALAILKATTERMTVVSAYAPKLSVTALLAYNNAFALYQTAASVINSAVSTMNTINGTGGLSVINENGLTKENIQKNQNKQQQMFQQIYGYWRSRTLFTIQTPWAVFQNCAINSVNAVQSAETNTVSDFEINFKVLRFANTNVTTKKATRATIQSSPLKDLGKSAMTSVNATFSSLFP